MDEVPATPASKIRSAVYRFIRIKFNIVVSIRYMIKHRPWDGFDYMRDRHKWLPTDPETAERLLKESEQAIALLPGRKINFNDVKNGTVPEQASIVADVTPMPTESEVHSAVYQFLKEEYGIDVAIKYMKETHPEVDVYDTNESHEWMPTNRKAEVATAT